MGVVLLKDVIIRMDAVIQGVKVTCSWCYDDPVWPCPVISRLTQKLDPQKEHEILEEAKCVFGSKIQGIKEYFDV